MMRPVFADDNLLLNLGMKKPVGTNPDTQPTDVATENERL